MANHPNDEHSGGADQGIEPRKGDLIPIYGKQSGSNTIELATEPLPQIRWWPTPIGLGCGENVEPAVAEERRARDLGQL